MPADRAAAGARGGGARVRSHRQPREQGARAPQVRHSQDRLRRLPRGVSRASCAKIAPTGAAASPSTSADEPGPTRCCGRARRVRQTAARGRLRRVARAPTASRSGRRATTPSSSRLDARRHHVGAAARRSRELARQFSDGTVRADQRAEPAAPLRARGEPAARCTPSSSRSGSAAPARARIARRDLVPGRRHLQPGGHARRASWRRPSATSSTAATGAAAERSRGRVARHQDLRLPELVRPAPRRGARLPRHACAASAA